MRRRACKQQDALPELIPGSPAHVPLRPTSVMTTCMLAGLAAAAAAASSTAPSNNMNGKYRVASADRRDVPFNDDYASKGHEYFDVWSPELATRVMPRAPNFMNSVLARATYDAFDRMPNSVQFAGMSGP